MFRDFQDLVEFRMIYIDEAHALDSEWWPISVAKEHEIYGATNLEDRCETAQLMIQQTGIEVPVLIDDMENSVSKAYKAFPTRLLVVGQDGRVKVVSNNGPLGIEKAVGQTREWLQEYRATHPRP